MANRLLRCLRTGRWLTRTHLARFQTENSTRSLRCGALFRRLKLCLRSCSRGSGHHASNHNNGASEMKHYSRTNAEVVLVVVHAVAARNPPCPSPRRKYNALPPRCAVTISRWPSASKSKSEVRLTMRQLLSPRAEGSSR